MRQTTFLMKIDATYYQSLVSAESFSMSSIIGHVPYRSSLLALDKVKDMLKLDKKKKMLFEIFFILVIL